MPNCVTAQYNKNYLYVGAAVDCCAVALSLLKLLIVLQFRINLINIVEPEPEPKPDKKFGSGPDQNSGFGRLGNPVKGTVSQDFILKTL